MLWMFVVTMVGFIGFYDFAFGVNMQLKGKVLKCRNDNKQLEMTCLSTAPSLPFYAEFLVNGSSVNSIRLRGRKCYNINQRCQGSVCSCNETGNSFTLLINISKETNISCVMRFPDKDTSTSIAQAHVYFDGKTFIPFESKKEAAIVADRMVKKDKHETISNRKVLAVVLAAVCLIILTFQIVRAKRFMHIRRKDGELTDNENQTEFTEFLNDDYHKNSENQPECYLEDLDDDKKRKGKVFDKSFNQGETYEQPLTSDERFFSELENNICCQECINVIQLHSFDICPGDHIKFSIGIKQHHAIVLTVNVDENLIKIVKLDHEKSWRVKTAILAFGKNKDTLKTNRGLKIIQVSNNKVEVLNYSAAIYRFSPEEIVRRATEDVSSFNVFIESKKRYTTLSNNCENYATWCVTGRVLNIQQPKLLTLIKTLTLSGLSYINNERIWIENKYKNGIVCTACYNHNKSLLNIARQKVIYSDDVRAGDVISYSYFFSEHEGVVIGEPKSGKNYIICEIVHYGYNGLFKHFTLKKEDVHIPLNGRAWVLRYPEDRFNLYNQAEVAKRAEMRIGEQNFSLFSNNSCQFVRWCKLKTNVGR